MTHTVILTKPYLKLSCPEMGRWIIDEAAGEVALHSANQVVILGVRALPGRTVSLVRRCLTEPFFTHDTIPNAWYSMIDDREIRARRPCCIPRSRRTIATFGEGCRSCQLRRDGSGTPRHGACTHNLNVAGDLPHCEPGDQDAADDMSSVTHACATRRAGTHRMVMPKANQKSCWWMTRIPSGFQEWVSRS